MTELPATWANAKFSDFGTWIGGGTPSKANPRFWNGPIPWVSPKDMKTKVIRKAIDGITEEAVENSAAKLVPAGSVLIVTRSGILAHTLPIAVTAVESTLNQDLKALALPDGISSDYVAWGMRAFEQRILDKCRKGGTTVHSIEMPRLAAFELPIAPTNEQRRIVEKIEAMFDEIDAGVESLQTARATLGLYRQSLLKSAFEGRLTADWRARNADKLEPPETLLARIQSEREAHYRAALDEWQEALAEWRANGENGKKPAKPKRPDEASAVEQSEADEIGQIPSEWAWVRPSLISEPTPHAIGIGPFGSNLKVSDYRDEGIPLVFVRNITQEDFSLSQKFVSPEKAAELDAHSIQAGDVLVTKMGDPPGDCTVYPVDGPYAIITADCLKFRVWKQFADRRFVSFMIRSNAVKRQLGLITQGVAQKKISVARFKTIALPLPSIAEQTEIVRIL